MVLIRVMSEAGNHITTYGLVDSGSDITMIDPSLVKLLNIIGIDKQTFTYYSEQLRFKGRRPQGQL